MELRRSTNPFGEDDGPDDTDSAAAGRPGSEAVSVDSSTGAGISMREADLTREVPSLLETMNRTSSEVNTFERQASEAQERHRRLLQQWSRLYDDLRARHGSAIDRVKPYFDAAQVLSAASQRVQRVVREFSAATSQHARAKVDLRGIEEQLAYGAHKVALDSDQQDGLSRATVWVLRCQQERDAREQEYARALRDYQEAQETLEAWRTQIGDSTINRTMPCFRQLQQNQSTLAAEKNRISAFTERARSAKTAYNNSMRELDRINISVHAARKEHDKYVAAPQAASCCGGSSSGDQQQEQPPEEAHPSPEAEGASDVWAAKAAVVTATAVDDGPFA